MVRVDSLIKTDIKDKLNFEPGLTSKSIVVNVENGIVTLSGNVGNYYEKSLAETAVKRVHDVKGVIEELQVNSDDSLKWADDEIAKAAVRALEWDSSLSLKKMKIIVEVKQGIVKLSGEVERQYQREKASWDVKYLFGVKGVVNNITLKPFSIKPEDVSRKILSEFQKNALIEASHICAETGESKVILKGAVRSWVEHEEARKAAWAELFRVLPMWIATN